VLTEFAAGGPSLVWDLVRHGVDVRHPGCANTCCCPPRLGRRDDAALWVASFAGAISAVLALIGFLTVGFCRATARASLP
jgi:hypothetical protein